MTQLLAVKLCIFLAVASAVIWAMFADTHNLSVSRPATAAETKYVSQAMTGWGTDFAKHK